MARKPTKEVKSEPAQASVVVDGDDELLLDDEYHAFAEVTEKTNSKTDARRRIEIYWEKKRLREQFEDFDDSEFGF
ncbi:MAG: hypothetical protein WC782_00990 [Methylococcaceae bacterium]|jgi:hypothetical protein